MSYGFLLVISLDKFPALEPALQKEISRLFLKKKSISKIK
jgi:hypothetical protein